MDFTEGAFQLSSFGNNYGRGESLGLQITDLTKDYLSNENFPHNMDRRLSRFEEYASQAENFSANLKKPNQMDTLAQNQNINDPSNYAYHLDVSMNEISHTNNNYFEDQPYDQIMKRDLKIALGHIKKGAVIGKIK